MADSKPVSKVVSLRVPTEWLEAVDRLAGIKYPSRTNKDKANRSQIILDAIEAYINTSNDTVNNTSDDSVNNVGLTEEKVLALVTTATSDIKESIQELSKKLTA